MNTLEEIREGLQLIQRCAREQTMSHVVSREHCALLAAVAENLLNIYIKEQQKEEATDAE